MNHHKLREYLPRNNKVKRPDVYAFCSDDVINASLFITSLSIQGVSFISNCRKKKKVRLNYSVLPTKMRITTAFLAFSITLVMMELSNAEGPIQPASFQSPVIISQTTQGLRSNTYKKFAFGKLTLQYDLDTAPVYRQGYPLYRYYIALRADRAARISKEELKLLNDEGKLCLGNSPEMKTLEKGIDDKLVKYTYSFSVNHGMRMTWPTKIDGTIYLRDPNTKYFGVTVRAKYSSPIVAGTTCTQIEATVEAAVVEMVKDLKPKVTTKPTRPTTKTTPTTKGGCNAGSQTD